MIEFSMSWVVMGESSGGNDENVSCKEVITKLRLLMSKGGSLNIDILNGPEIGPQNLSIACEQNNFVVSLGEDDGEDYIVRTLKSENNGGGQIVVLGNYWDADLVCNDEKLVERIVINFLESGDVSREILN